MASFKTHSSLTEKKKVYRNDINSPPCKRATIKKSDPFSLNVKSKKVIR